MRNNLFITVSLLCLAGLAACSGSNNGGGGGTEVMISGASVSTVTATSATVSWTTNVSASSLVAYGTTTAYGLNVSDPTLVTSHSLTLNSLTCNTTYHYQITSAAAPGNSVSTADSTFTTGACPIMISAVSATTTATSATVSWTTNVSASSTRGLRYDHRIWIERLRLRLWSPATR